MGYFSIQILTSITGNKANLLNPLSAVIKVYSSTIAVAAITPSGTFTLNCCLIFIASFFMALVKGITVQKSMADWRVVISF